jgi:hypothetical protein
VKPLTLRLRLELPAFLFISLLQPLRPFEDGARPFDIATIFNIVER